MTNTEQTAYTFQAEVSQVLRLVIDSLYSNKDVFLRELLSNASDALDKLRFRAQTEDDLMQSDERLAIQLVPSEEEGVLEIRDNGVGMTKDELISNLGTIARSGSKAFLSEFQKAKDEGASPVELIGQFGVGFYSAFLVADKVEVISLAAGERQAHRWESEAKDSFSIEEASRAERGTTVRLHLKEDHKDLTSTWKLRDLVRTYSDYLTHDIEIPKEAPADGEGDDDAESKVIEQSFETINAGKPLWQKRPSEVEAEQYTEFYKHLSSDWEAPAAHKHFHIEGTQQFSGVVFIPTRPPFDLFMPEAKHGLRLHVKRVLVMERCEELLPKWLRFVQGVVDSQDLPLNVSRETLQDTGAIKVMQKQVVKRSLDAIATLAEDEEAYAKFWNVFGVVLKEGLHFDVKNREKIAELIRFRTSKSEGELTSLAAYRERMPEEQKVLYYALGESDAQLAGSPHLEVLKSRGFEVIYATDPVDQWAFGGLGKYDELDFVSASDADLKLDDDEADKSIAEAKGAAYEALCTRIQTHLADKVSEVRVSTRLTDSPVCLVVPEGALEPHVIRMLRAANQQVPETKRVMEINPDHALLQNLERLRAGDEDAKLDDWIDLVFDQALLAEGSPLPEPAKFAKRVTELLVGATA